MLSNSDVNQARPGPALAKGQFVATRDHIKAEVKPELQFLNCVSC